MTSHTYIHDVLLSWLDTETSMKNNGLDYIYGTKHSGLILPEYLSWPPFFICFTEIRVFYVVKLHDFTFFVLYCDVLYDFRKTLFVKFPFHRIFFFRLHVLLMLSVIIYVD